MKKLRKLPWAVECPIIIRAKNCKFFVGFTKKSDKQKAFIIGGGIGVLGYHMETITETAIRGAREAIGMEVTFEQRFSGIFMPTMIAVKVAYRGRELEAALYGLGNFETADDTKISDLGIKKIYQSTAYSLTVHAEKLDLNQVDIETWLRPGRGVDKIIVVEPDDAKKIKFGFDHHRKICHRALLYA